MKVNKEMTKIICKLESIIGKQTNNPNSYNGWTGEEGCSYKYPVSYCRSKTELSERKIIKERYIYDIEPECIKTVKYVIGSNHLYIGDGIVKVLEFLEERYNIVFNQLEDEFVKK